MNKWQKILLGVSAGMLTLATLVPGTAIITLPLIGKIVAVTALKVAAGTLAGVAIKTPGHVATNAPTP